MEVDLEHHLLPDPIADMLAAMQAKINELEQGVGVYERSQLTDIQYSQRAKEELKTLKPHEVNMYVWDLPPTTIYI